MTRFFLSLLAALLITSTANAQDSSSNSQEVCDETDLSCDEFDDQDEERFSEITSEPGDIVILRGLDKVTARTRDFEIGIGESEQFGSLEVQARYCRKRPPEEPPETFAFLEVFDRRTDGFGTELDGDKIFSGWMLGSNPALNPLEHPVYDVWVIDCRNSQSDDL